MPRLRKTAEEIANLNFAGEIDKRKRMEELKDKHIAEAVGVSRQTILKWKQNPEIIPAGKLRSLIRFLKIPPEEILAFLK
ncbi:helix-turn-helix domain-containing protein [Papillibacter cinnamivorans]|uniref:HTH cro/C1-type domain-containing protein n=1 Tax=Papillibacter cinnamivorans DSM 12816 TaxID=1122930 RepID=A0A1W1YZT1_9FIRM|nr:helix-turn-helix domain-containing protein [Papillibacter cinnamivorans]SMC41331.1 hypothetical protein SAMN02745168_0786 [Papillibacter cinnamivorans DSM 12816]